jgi:hypothetical protein
MRNSMTNKLAYTTQKPEQQHPYILQYMCATAYSCIKEGSQADNFVSREGGKSQMQMKT